LAVEEEVVVALGRAAPHSSRRSQAGRQKAQCQREKPRAQVAPRLLVPQKTRKMEELL
jgi:hypothetical protein